MTLLHTLLTILALTAFTAGRPACNRDSTVTVTGKWRLIKYHNRTAGTSDFEPPNIPRSIGIEFSDNGFEGKMTGQTVTNNVLGNYTLTKGNKMKTISFGGTKAGEPAWGSKFWDAIRTATSYHRQNNKLFIFFNSDQEKMEFKKEDVQ